MSCPAPQVKSSGIVKATCSVLLFGALDGLHNLAGPGIDIEVDFCARIVSRFHVVMPDARLDFSNRITTFAQLSLDRGLP